MGDHFVLLVDRLLTESTLEAALESRLKHATVDETMIDYSYNKDNEASLSPRKLVECRICQDDDFDSNMESPCSCSGSLKVGCMLSFGFVVTSFWSDFSSFIFEILRSFLFDWLLLCFWWIISSFPAKSLNMSFMFVENWVHLHNMHTTFITKRLIVILIVCGIVALFPLGNISDKTPHSTPPLF